MRGILIRYAKVIMKVLIICNNAFMRGNGMFTALQSLKRHLIECGIDARLMANKNSDATGPQPEFPLHRMRIPFFDKVIRYNGFDFAKADTKILRRAIEWADVVHIEEGFPLEVKALTIAHQLGKPSVASFHLFAQNVVANAIHGKTNHFLNRLVMWYWRKYTFNRCLYVHCPTKLVASVLERSGFTTEKRIFSNGIDIPEERIVAQSLTPNKPIKIISIGRLAFEKAQYTLFDAMRYSKYSKHIQLIFAGNGPMKARYQRMDAKLHRQGILSHETVFGFYNHDTLAQMVRDSYLYIHTAWVEVEGLSCIEAIRQGIVPIIAEGNYTASSQFALHPQSLFPECSAQALAERIDWWIEHPNERNSMAQQYADSARNYNVKDSIKQMIKMYSDAIEDTKENA